MITGHFSDADFNDGSPITLREASHMVDRLNEALETTAPDDPRQEPLGHARFLWSELRHRLEEGDTVTERPTPGFDFL
jgi:hypothetical protein